MKSQKVVFVAILVMFSLFFITPLLTGFYISFTNMNGLGKDYQFVGLDNYLKMFLNPRLLSSMKITLKYLCYLLPTILVMGYVNATFLRSLNRMNQVFLFMFFIPYILMPVAVSMIFNQIYSKLLVSVGKILDIAFLKTSLLSRASTALLAVSFVDIWMLVPYSTLLFYSALNLLPKNQIQAAKLDGASKFQLFRYIKFPYLCPTIATVTTVIFSYALTHIDTLMTLSAGGPGRSSETLYFLVYQNAMIDQKMGLGAAEGILLAFVSIGVYLLLLKVTKRKEKTTVFKKLIYGFIVSIVVFIPIYLCVVNSFKSNTTLISDFFQLPAFLDLSNFEYLFFEKDVLKYLLNSFLMTTIVVMMVGIINPFFAYYIAMHWQEKRYRWIYYIISSCMLIPSQILIFSFIRILYKLNLMNFLGLMIYYAVFMIPECLFMLVPYFRFFQKNLKDAAYLDGCRGWQFYLKIFLPVSKPIVTVVLVLSVIWVYNDFFMPLMILNKSPQMWTMPIFLYNFMGRFSYQKNYAFFSAFISMLPILIFYFIFHKKIIQGFEGGNDHV